MVSISGFGVEGSGSLHIWGLRIPCRSDDCEMVVPSNGDVKEPLRTQQTLAMTTLSARKIKVGLAKIFIRLLVYSMRPTDRDC